MALIEYYAQVKAAHVGLVMLSGSIFVGRGIAVIMGDTLVLKRPVRIASMVIDTALLAAAITLLVMLSWNPFTISWLQAKLVLLLGYIGFGMMTLRFAKTQRGKVIGYVLALLCYVMMFSIARAHDPLGFFSGI